MWTVPYHHRKDEHNLLIDCVLLKVKQQIFHANSKESILMNDDDE